MKLKRSLNFASAFIFLSSNVFAMYREVPSLHDLAIKHVFLQYKQCGSKDEQQEFINRLPNNIKDKIFEICPEGSMTLETSKFVVCVKFSPCGKFLIIGFASNELEIYSLDSKKSFICQCFESRGNDTIWDIAFSNDTKMLAIACSNREVKIFDWSNYIEQRELICIKILKNRCTEPNIHKVCFIDNEFLAICSDCFCILDSNTQRDYGFVLHGFIDDPIAFAQTIDNKNVLVGSNNGYLYWFRFDGENMESVNRVIYSLKKGYQIDWIKFSSDGVHSVFAIDGSIKIYNSDSYKDPIFEIKRSKSKYFKSALFSNNGKYLIAGTADGKINFFDFSNKCKYLRVAFNVGSEIRSLEFSPDGRYLIALANEITIIDFWSILFSDAKQRSVKNI